MSALWRHLLLCGLFGRDVCHLTAFECLWECATRYALEGDRTDGVLIAAFKAVGLHNGAWWNASGTFLELGAGDGYGSKTHMLRQRAGWRGWLVDADYSNPDIGLHKEWLTETNVVESLQRLGVTPHLDLLVVDVDFNSFWIWRALLSSRVVRPRVVVMAVNSFLGANASVVVR